MMAFLQFSAIVAMLSAWLVLLLKKTGVVEWLQVHGNSFVARLAMCDFCLSWWACVAVSVCALFIAGDVLFLFVPFVATPITRAML